MSELKDRFDDILEEDIQTNECLDALRRSCRPEETALIIYLRAMRKAQGLTQEELGEKIGCTQETVSVFEDLTYTGRSLRTIYEYAKALEVELIFDILVDNDSYIR